MDRGTYSAASAGLLESRKLELVNNNLANVNTPGFKKQYLVSEVQDFEDTLAARVATDDPYAAGDHERSPGVLQIKTVTDFSIGSIKTTGNPLHVALQDPNQFFVIDTPEGEQYTRAGNFTLNVEGQLVSAEGYPVIGNGGPIVTTGPGVSISGNGTVTTNDGNTQLVGRVQVVEFENPSQLDRVGGSRFVLQRGAQQPEEVPNVKLVTGSLEMSNVSAIESVIDLINATKGFELYTKAAKSIDELNQTSIQQIGRSS